VFALTRTLVVLAACTLTLVGTTAHATVPADLCTGNPCTVTGNKTITPPVVLDFGATTDVVLAGSAIVTVGAGGPSREVQIIARSITLQPGARILGGGDLATVILNATGGALRLQASGSTKARIDLSGNQGGTAILLATGDVEIAGPISTAGSGTDSQGGDISIDSSAGAVTVSELLNSGAGGSGSGGGETSVMAAGAITINGRIDTSAADFGGGPVSLLSTTGSVTVTQPIDVSGGGPDGSGGSVDIGATLGNVTLSSTITGKAGSGTDFACGDGSEVLIFSGLSTTIGAAIDVSGGTQCFGGEVSVDARLDFTQLASGSIAARGPGAFGGGGSFILGAGRNATLRGIDLTSPGFGGTVDVIATGTLDVLGTIDAEAGGAEGIGGQITMQACVINVAATGFLDTRGAFAFPGTGTNRLRAGGLVTVLGQMRATSANAIEHRGLPPVLAGTIVPAATITVDPELPDCVELAQCGNTVPDEGEVCDDGNNNSCDGCNADCTRVDAVCGDDTRECGEQCDDGNTDSGDGCEADCTLPPQAGVLVPGLPLPNAGCEAEWKLAFNDAATNPNTNLPATTQICTDGDPGCDTDLTRDGVCTFGTQLCLRVPDERLPGCTPAGITSVNIKQPVLPGGSNPLDQGNAQALATGLTALGGEVRSGNNVLQSGPPITGSNVCTQTIPFKVAHQPAGLGKRAFNVAAEDANGLTMSSNLVRLWCAPNTTVCGNGTEEVTEACDDGNTSSCDGCSSTCKVEACGNGIVECNEFCDDGSLNGTPGNRCSATCTELPPDLRIPGGGAKALDCAYEWSAELGTVTTDAKGLPKTSQTCVDNDPACDFDPTPGTCRFRVWGCVGAADSRIACSAQQISRVDAKAPNANAKRPEDIAARASLIAGLSTFTFPAGPGEVCSAGFQVNVPAGNRRVTLKAEARLSTGKKDMDALQLKCVPQVP
jgi:cysteine-rich repeat protein